MTLSSSIKVFHEGCYSPQKFPEEHFHVQYTDYEMAAVVYKILNKLQDDSQILREPGKT